MKLTTRPLTPDLWPAFEDLFGKSGASNGCWCMYWRIGSAYRQAAPGEDRYQRNRAAFKAVVKRGPPPGLLAFDGVVAVGWCQLTPRGALPWLERRATRTWKAGAAPAWAISCFYIRKGYRRQGVTVALIEAALDLARKAGAPALEAYPLDARETTSTSFTGYASTFARAGFKTVGRPSPARPIMRHDLKTIGR